jgi:hypothetical protein
MVQVVQVVRQTFQNLGQGRGRHRHRWSGGLKDSSSILKVLAVSRSTRHSFNVQLHTFSHVFTSLTPLTWSVHLLWYPLPPGFPFCSSIKRSLFLVPHLDALYILNDLSFDLAFHPCNVLSARSSWEGATMDRLGHPSRIQGAVGLDMRRRVLEFLDVWERVVRDNSDCSCPSDDCHNMPRPSENHRGPKTIQESK